MESPAVDEDTTPQAQQHHVQNQDRRLLFSSLRANSSDFIADVLDEGGEEADDHAADDDDDELTAEEKKDADIGSSVPTTIESSANDTNDPKSHEGVAYNETSVPPLPAVGGSSMITFKFSYQPRDYEQNYYDQLFYHVASTSNTPGVSENKPKEEIIVSPKEAAKLFYKSGVPSERLRMIWNMATLPSTPLPPGTKPPPSMTYGQFRVAVRLIQLFQNRVAAVDEQLTVSEQNNNSGEGVGGSDEGLTSRLAPAYFNGVSGEIIPLPNNNVVQVTKTMYGGEPSEPNGMSPSTPNEVTRLPRRSSTLSSLSTNEGRMNGNVSAPGEANLNTAEPMSLAEMEREIRRLTAVVGILQREVKELKRDNRNVPRHDVAEDEDPTVGVEIYWGEREEKEESPEKRTVTPPNEVPLKAKSLRPSKYLRSSMPISPQHTTMDSRRIATSKNRLSQSQNIPSMHPSIPRRRSKTNSGMGTAATGVAQVSVQPTKIPPEGETLTSQMHAVREQEEFDTLLIHAKERTEGENGSKTGSRQSNRSGSFRPTRVAKRSARNNRPADLSASARHIVRDKTGKVELYTNFEVERSTKAVDLAPLNPPPLQPSFDEQVPVAQNHRRSLMRRR